MVVTCQILVVRKSRVDTDVLVVGNVGWKCGGGWSVSIGGGCPKHLFWANSSLCFGNNVMNLLDLLSEP